MLLEYVHLGVFELNSPHPLFISLLGVVTRRWGSLSEVSGPGRTRLGSHTATVALDDIPREHWWFMCF